MNPYSEATPSQDPYGALAEEIAMRTAQRYGLPADQNEFELAMMHAALDAVTEALHRARTAGLLLLEGAETQPLMRQLAERRRALGLTQQDVADVTGKAQNTVSGWETGNREPLLIDLEDYARLVGCWLTLAPREVS